MIFKKMRPAALSLFVAASALLSSNMAMSAQPVDIDGALYIQNKIQEQLDMPNFGMSSEGAVEVEPAGNYYAVTLPHIRLDMPTPPSEMAPQGGKFAFDFGISALNMVPTDIKGQYVFSQSIPTPWRFYNNDQETFRLSIEKQKTSGVYDLEMNLATRLDAQYDNINFIDAQTGNPLFHIDSIVAKGGYDEKKAGHYTGRLPVEIKGFQVLDDKSQPFLIVDKIKAYSGYTDLSRANTMKCMKDMQTVNKQITSYVKTEQVVDPTVIAGFLDTALACMGILADGMEGGLVIEGAKIGPALAASMGMQNVTLDSLYSQSFFTDIMKEKMGVALKLGMQNINFQPWPAGYSKYAPRSFHIDIGVDNIPHSKLHKIVKNVLGMYSQDAQTLTANPQMILLPIMAQVPKLLNEAQSGFVANDVRISGDGYQAILKGRVQSDINAIYGASGKGTLTFYNMDKFMEGITAEAQDPNNPNAAGMMPMLMPIKLFFGFGQDDGQGNRVYNFELTQQGQFMLNGQDLKSLMGGMGQQGGNSALPAPSAP